MPLNRPPLPLGSGASSVKDARRWVVTTCRDIGRHDLVDCAELGVSELVTNALLHARPPFSVRVRGTREHPRVEVRDGSDRLPIMPRAERPSDDVLLTFGRGLGIVARCATAWGVVVEEDGKAVWFAPAGETRDHPAEGLVTAPPAPPGPEGPAPDEIRVHLFGVPVRLFVEFQQHFRELRREVRLLALAHGSEYPVARRLSEHFGQLDHDLRQGLGVDQIDRALEDGAQTADLAVVMPRHTAAVVERFLELLDMADAFCRAERLLSLARTPEQREFQRWFLGELVRQGNGERPLAWQDARVSSRR